MSEVEMELRSHPHSLRVQAEEEGSFHLLLVLVMQPQLSVPRQQEEGALNHGHSGTQDPSILCPDYQQGLRVLW